MSYKARSLKRRATDKRALIIAKRELAMLTKYRISLEARLRLNECKPTNDPAHFIYCDVNSIYPATDSMRGQ